jgi:hypothetical protein
MKEKWPFISPGYHQTYTITPSVLRIWLNKAGFEVISLSTFGLALNSFSDKVDSFIIREVTAAIERMLRFLMMIIVRVFKPLNLGDSIFLVARRVC